MWPKTALFLYDIFLITAAVFAAHRLWLAFQAWRTPIKDPKTRTKWRNLPPVTVQLPVYNEKYVIERLIQSVCAMEYPRKLFEIQVLDDSTDETSCLVDDLVAKYRHRGFHINCLRRKNRNGFKAGALEEGLKKASGEFIAIFDADFIPPIDFFHKTIHFFTQPSIGMVQVRWAHQNASDSLLTKLQSAIIDSHFMVDQVARSAMGVFFNFNGSAGIWRKKTIQNSGGWQSDTLAEDMDLSYRAQMAGWRFVLLSQTEVPQELPRNMRAFRQQQFRWSKGSFEVARKHFLNIWRSRLSFRVKFEAAFHMFGNIAFAFVALSTLLALPMAMFPYKGGGLWQQYLIDFPVTVICFGATFIYYAFSQCRLYQNPFRRLLFFPIFLAIVSGLALIHIKALIEVLLGKKTPFIRTPKQGVLSGKPTTTQSIFSYRVALDGLFILEFLGTLYLAVTVFYAMQKELFETLPFTLLLLAGFLYATVRNLSESRLWGSLAIH